MSRKITLVEAKDRIKSRHGDLVTILDSSYVGFRENAEFIHAIHGSFHSTPKAVCLGHLSVKFKSKEMSLSIEEIKKRLLEFHGNIVTIKEETYVNSSTEAIFVDSDYGEWPGRPSTIIRGSGHPQRADDNHRISLKEVKSRLLEVHKGIITIIDSTYTKVVEEAIFVDIEFGEFPSLVNSVLHGAGHVKRRDFNNWVPLEEIKKRILGTHGNIVSIIESTYKGTTNKAIFNDIEYGNWPACPKDVCEGQGHPVRGKLKAARKLNNPSIKFHWKTNEELVCQASYEPKVIDHLNENKINYSWQSKTFTMPNGRTYRPDLYLIDQDIWVEIKGYMRPDAKIKWDWFKTEYPTAELWTEKVLIKKSIL